MIKLNNHPAQPPKFIFVIKKDLISLYPRKRAKFEHKKIQILNQIFCHC